MSDRDYWDILEPDEDETDDDCDACGESLPECLCPCGFCLRFGNDCVCDEWAEEPCEP